MIIKQKKLLDKQKALAFASALLFYVIKNKFREASGIKANFIINIDYSLEKCYN